mmetsp:Transcript_4200/g.8487  ORF Transcript_4200/g.8487 Transcript_4200/m.8487 type:complete len:237 (+) Transcript_4200:121-831(+)
MLSFPRLWYQACVRSNAYHPLNCLPPNELPVDPISRHRSHVLASPRVELHTVTPPDRFSVADNGYVLGAPDDWGSAHGALAAARGEPPVHHPPPRVEYLDGVLGVGVDGGDGPFDEQLQVPVEARVGGDAHARLRHSQVRACVHLGVLFEACGVRAPTLQPRRHLHECTSLCSGGQWQRRSRSDQRVRVVPVEAGARVEDEVLGVGVVCGGQRVAQGGGPPRHPHHSHRPHRPLDP